MTVFKDSHDFSKTLGNVSAELWAMFDDNLSRPPSLQQNFGQCSMTAFKDSHDFSRTLGNVSWQSLKTAITYAELWAMFQQNFGQCLKTVFTDRRHFSRTLSSVWWQSLMTTLFSKEPFAAAFGKNVETQKHTHRLPKHMQGLPPPAKKLHQTNLNVAAGSVSPTSMKKTT